MALEWREAFYNYQKFATEALHEHSSGFSRVRTLVIRSRVPSMWWRWRVVARFPWHDPNDDHINVKEARALLSSLQWRFRKVIQNAIPQDFQVWTTRFRVQGNEANQWEI